MQVMISALPRAAAARRAGRLAILRVMTLVIFTTGGTIDKVYFDARSEFEVGEPQIGNILREAMVGFDFEVRSLMQKDSLDMTDGDRALIRAAVEHCEADHILITHGTDTMAE